MSVGTIVGIGLLTAVACLLLRQYHPTGSLLVAIAGGCVIFLGVVGFVSDLIDFATELLQLTLVDHGWLLLLLKVLGISYACKFGADLCRDAGENAVAGYVETAGKVIMVALTLPGLLELVETVTELIKR